MKKCLAALLAVLMTLNLCVTAFALSLSPIVDKTSVSAGESVIVSVSADEATENVTVAELCLYFDDTKFEWDKDNSKPVAANIGIYPDVCDNAGRKYIKILFIAESTGEATLGTDTLAEIAFKAKADISENTSASFSSSIAKMMVGDDQKKNVTAEVPVSVTVTPITGYAVAASAVNSAITVGEDAQVKLAVSNRDATTYNAYYMEVSYDADKLTYKSISTDATVQEGSGTLKIAGYGDDKTCGTDNILLTFTGKATGSAAVTVTSAKVDAGANVVEYDAPDATITTGTATITIDGYKVTLPEGFTGDETAAAGGNYTFTALDTTKKYDFSGSTMGGADVTVKDNGNGTYTIENVTGELVIKATEKSTKATIVESGDWKDVVSRNGWKQSGDQVDAGTSLFFTISRETGYTYTVTVNGDTLPGQTRPGAYMYSIPTSYVKAGETVTIHITKTADQPAYTVNVSEYVKLGSKSIYLITASGEVADGKVLTYAGSAMFWSAKYNENKGAYAWLVLSDKTPDEVKADAATKIQAADGTQTAIAYDGDVNLTTRTDINDVQLVWNMYNARYSDFQTVSVRKFLEADMNADGKVDTADAAAITALLFQ